MTPLVFTVIAFLGAFVGFAMGFFGIGGGAFIIPILVRVADLEWEQAIGLSLAMMVPTGAIGAWNRARHGEVDYRLGLTVFLGSIPGALIGRQIVRLLSDAPPIELGPVKFDLLDTGLTFCFFTFLLWMSSRIRKEVASAETEKSASDIPGNPFDYARPPLWEAALLGVAVGASSAMMGVGGAFLFIPIALERFRMPATLVAGTSLFQLPLTAGVGAIIYRLDGGVQVPYVWLIPILLGSTLGVTYGVRFSRRFSNERLRATLGRLLMAIAFLLAISWLIGLRAANAGA